MVTSVTGFVLFILTLAALIAFIRLLKGPSLPDRVVATDLMGTIVVGLLVVGAAASNEPAFLDAAIVIALIAFVSTIAYSRYIEREGP